MKKAIYSLGLLCLVVSIDAKSQSSKPANKPIKGYYSIGNNAEKLTIQKSDVAQQFDVTTYPIIPKGYYATGAHNQKLGTKIIQGREPLQKKPAITKGYYSIGKNATKIK